MLAIDGFLRGLWVGVLVALLWWVFAALTGCDWMRPLTQWVFLLTMIVVALEKIGRHLP